MTGVPTGYVVFVNRNYPWAYGYGGKFYPDPEVERAGLVAGWWISAWAIGQVINVEVEYSMPPGVMNLDTTYCYHINPARVDKPNEERFTRLGVAFDDYNDEDHIYEIEVPAQWPLVAGETAAVLFRHTWLPLWGALMVARGVVT